MIKVFGAFRQKCGASQFEPINHTGGDGDFLTTIQRKSVEIHGYFHKNIY